MENLQSLITLAALASLKFLELPEDCGERDIYNHRYFRRRRSSRLSHKQKCLCRAMALKRRVLFRCPTCMIGDDEFSERNCSCEPLEIDQERGFNPSTKIAQELKNLKGIENPPFTPIIVTDGLISGFPCDITECNWKLPYRTLIRETYYMLLFQTFNPPPYITILAGSDAITRKNVDPSLIRDESSRYAFTNSFKASSSALGHFLNTLNGGLSISPLIPQLYEHHTETDYLDEDPRKSDIRNTLFALNTQLASITEFYGSRMHVDAAKFVCKSPPQHHSNKWRYLNHARFEPDGITPTKETLTKMRRATFSHTISSAGLWPKRQRIQKDQFESWEKVFSHRPFP